jgi:hypothetical protein
MNSCGHVSYAYGCGGCEFRTQRAEDQRERERHHKERLKAYEKSQRPQSGGYAPAPRQSGGGGGGGFSLEGAAVLVGVFIACVLYVITSTLVFAVVPVLAVAAGAALVAKHALHKTLPGRFDALPIYWWAAVIVIAVVDKVFRSHPASVNQPIVNVTNLGLFLLTMAAGYGLFVVYRRTPAPEQAQ